ncbi:unnamed protein product [Heterobilharzia americana]|nr:unnamed protein product [Heterobilharzia americana]
MGGRVSRGRDNQSLIDELVNSGLKLNPEVERSLRLVDRGGYFDEKSPRAYMDLAWRSGSLHLSAPSIYIVALKNLDIQPGNCFLNVGSGTGYLSTVIGLLLGHNGINHGIEVNDFNINFSREHLAAFMSECDAPFERSFCPPVFLHGNILDLVVPLDQPSGLNEHLSVFLQSSLASQSEIVHNDSDSQSNVNIINSSSLHASTEERQGHSSEVMEVEENGLMDEDNTSENSGHNEGDGEGDSGSDPVSWEEDFTVDLPPCIHFDNSSSNQQNSDVLRWPVYDRIYVGAAVTNRIHLQSILRLLKVGGILVAPYRDKFMKIRRVDENKVTASELMSVTFATLLPSIIGSRKKVEPPPKQEVTPLEQLAARLIRRLLRQVIEYRHNGPPVLGRMEEIEVDEGEMNETCDMSEELESSVDTVDVEESDEINREGGVLRSRSPCGSPTSARNCPMARFLHYLINHAEIGQGRDPLNEESDQNTTEFQRSHSPYLQLNFRRFLSGVGGSIIATATGHERSYGRGGSRINSILNTRASINSEPISDEQHEDKSIPRKKKKNIVGFLQVILIKKKCNVYSLKNCVLENL